VISARIVSSAVSFSWKINLFVPQEIVQDPGEFSRRNICGCKSSVKMVGEMVANKTF
jgi:hypothetical protein